MSGGEVGVPPEPDARFRKIDCCFWKCYNCSITISPAQTTHATTHPATISRRVADNISDGGWGAGGAFPYLWQQDPAAFAADTSNDTSNGMRTGTCTVGTLNPGVSE